MNKIKVIIRKVKADKKRSVEAEKMKNLILVSKFQNYRNSMYQIK